jgi:imidazolonepropionase-like amidohydrolase
VKTYQHIKLTFEIAVEHGSIDPDRILDAATAAAYALGIERGDIKPGARLSIRWPRQKKAKVAR